MVCIASPFGCNKTTLKEEWHAMFEAGWITNETKVNYRTSNISVNNKSRVNEKEEISKCECLRQTEDKGSSDAATRHRKNST